MASHRRRGQWLVESISRVELQRLIAADGVQVVDVLPDAEYQRNHIPGALNIPLKTLDEKTTQALQRDKPIAVY